MGEEQIKRLGTCAHLVRSIIVCIQSVVPVEHPAKYYCFIGPNKGAGATLVSVQVRLISDALTAPKRRHARKALLILCKRAFIS